MVFIQKVLKCSSKQINRPTDQPNYFTELKILKLSCFKRLKSCHLKAQIAKWSLMWQDVSPLQWQNFKIQVQEYNLVHLFGKMTNPLSFWMLATFDFSSKSKVTLTCTQWSNMHICTPLWPLWGSNPWLASLITFTLYFSDIEMKLKSDQSWQDSNL